MCSPQGMTLGYDRVQMGYDQTGHVYNYNESYCAFYFVNLWKYGELSHRYAAVPVFWWDGDTIYCIYVEMKYLKL